MSEIRTEFLFTVDFTVARRSISDTTPLGDRRNVTVTRRDLRRPAAAWDGAAGSAPTGSWRGPTTPCCSDVRATLETDDGAFINMTYRGLRHGPPLQSSSG